MGSLRARRALHFVGHNERFSDLLHGFAALPALLLQRKVGAFFIESQVALQNAFGAFDQLTGLEFFG